MPDRAHQMFVKGGSINGMSVHAVSGDVHFITAGTTGVDLTGRHKNLTVTAEAPSVRLSHRHAKQRTASYRTLV